MKHPIQTDLVTGRKIVKNEGFVELQKGEQPH